MTLFVNMNPAVTSFLKLTAHKAGFPVEVISFYIVPHNPACSALAGRGTFRSRSVGDSVTPFREVLMMKKSDKKAKQVKKPLPLCMIVVGIRLLTMIFAVVGVAAADRK
jgi:hypothetical protein